MMLKLGMLGAAALLALSGAANAATVVIDSNFDDVATSGQQGAYWSAPVPPTFDLHRNPVTSGGTTWTMAGTDPANDFDVVGNGDYGIGCLGGTGKCLDMAGTSSGGTGPSNNYLYTDTTVSWGSMVEVEVWFSGNQRGADAGRLKIGFKDASWSPAAAAHFSGLPTKNRSLIAVGFGCGVNNPADPGIPGVVYGCDTTPGLQSGILSNQIWTRVSIKARATTFDNVGGLAYIQPYVQYLGIGSDLNQGVMIDSIRVISSVVPEPSTWMLMILGFGLIAGQLRRRHRDAIAAA
jgi:hypothetical protein